MVDKAKKVTRVRSGAGAPIKRDKREEMIKTTGADGPIVAEDTYRTKDGQRQKWVNGGWVNVEDK